MKKTKLLSLILSAAVTAATLAGCGGTNQSSQPQSQNASLAGSAGNESEENANIPDYLNATGFPIVNTPITLTAMVSQNEAQPQWSEILVWQEYEKMSGITIDWDCILSSSISEKRGLALASDQLPDMFYRSSMSETEMLKYGQQGYFLDLSQGMIDQYAPNFKSIIENFEDVRKGIPTAEGQIYAFPGLSNTWPVEVNPKLFLNQKWLKAVGKSSPTTTDEFYEVLKAFKGTDCNGNGKSDEIPLSSTSLANILRILRGAWGLGTRGFGNENFDIAPNGDFRFIPASNEYKEQLEYLNKLYTEGLLDQQIFTIDSKTLLAQNEAEQVGCFAFTNVGAVASSNASDFAGLGTALKGPHGDQLYAAVRGHIATKTGMLITKECQHPEAAVRWIDYFYGDEGAELIYAGVEGQTYTKDSNGRCTIVSEYTTIPEGSSFDKVFSVVSPWAGGGLPAISNERVFQGAEIHEVAAKEAEAVKQYAPEELWAPFSFTLDESSQKADLESDLNSYISQKRAEFIQGKTPLSEFDNYVKEMKSMGLDDYIQLYKTAYERYQKN